VKFGRSRPTHAATESRSFPSARSSAPNSAAHESPDGNGGPGLHPLTVDGAIETAGGVLNAEIARAVVRTYREFSRPRSHEGARPLPGQHRRRVEVFVLEERVGARRRSAAEGRFRRD
jgi:hypothetical protein